MQLKLHMFAFESKKMGYKQFLIALTILLSSGIIHSQEFPFVEGQKLKTDSSNTIYLVLDKQLRQIDSNLLFSGLFNDYRNVTVIADSVLKTMYHGPMIKDAFIIKGYSNDIYLYIDQQKRHIESPEVMDAFGFNWNFVRRMTLNEISEIPNGNNITVDGSQIYPLPCGVSDKD